MTRGLVVLLAVVGGLAGCSAGGGPDAIRPTAAADPTAAYQAQALAIGREFAECARANGKPHFPDGAIDARGALTFPGAPKEDLLSVEPACGPILQQLPPPGGQNQTPSAEDMQRLRQFAECFRVNGVPEWPDPAPDGTFPIDGTPLEVEMNTSPISARLLGARQACRHLEGENPFR